MYKKMSPKVNILPLIALFLVAHSFNGPKGSEIALNEGLDQKLEESRESRVKALEGFFEEVNSPLKPQASTFVEVADKYGIDYKLLPAISCIESSCGVKLIEGSFNPFGWGIYGNNAIYFESWEDGIETVAKGIRENYFSKGFNTPEKMAPIYTPPNSANWLYAVRGFMYRIESYRDLPLILDSVSLEA
ncbi:hypothetical protein ACFLZ4_00590 [Patescibacteria group bacterium]